MFSAWFKFTNQIVTNNIFKLKKNVNSIFLCIQFVVGIYLLSDSGTAVLAVVHI